MTLNFNFKYIAKHDIISTKESGKMKENKINFTLRIEPTLKFQLERIAHNESRTLSNVMNIALQRYVDMYNGEVKK